MSAAVISPPPSPTEAAKCPVDHSTLSKEAWESFNKQQDRHVVQRTPVTSAANPPSSPLTPLACDSSAFCPLPSTASPSSPTSSSLTAAAALHTVGDVFPDATPSPSQRLPLSTAPVASSIPRSGVDPATSQPHSVWTFPSPQRFFNAMQRKGWNPREVDMPHVVSIHNTVNEETWRRVLRYEALHRSQCGDVRLARFKGRPNDPSPKARMMGWMGYTAPFDRHDWYVDRCGREVRYIIDFYAGHDEGEAVRGGRKAAAIHIDARPALDSPGAVVDRLRMKLQDFW